MESWVIFKLYGGRWQFLVLYAAALLLVIFKARDRSVRLIFAWLPLFVLIMFLCPPFRKVYVALLGDGDTQYRLLWTVPMGMTVAYAGCLATALVPMRGEYLVLKRSLDRVVIPIVVCAAVILCGSLVYKNPLVTRAENLYHIPQEAIEVADLMAPKQIPGQQRIRVRAAVPSDLVHFIRQYNTDIVLAFGRDIIAYGYYNEIHEKMEKPEIIDMDELKRALKDGGVKYLVLNRERKTNKEPEEAGLVLYAETESYIIYEVTE